MITGTVVLLLLAAGAVPWPRWRRRAGEDPGSSVEDGAGAVAGHGHAGIGGELQKGAGRVAMAPVSAPSSMLSSPSLPSLQPWWRQALWLSFWIIVPAYGVYCASMRHFASPIEWLERAGDLAGGWGILAVVAGVMALAAIFHFVPKVPPYVGAMIPAAGLVTLGISLQGVMRSGGKPVTFDSGYWPVATRWWDLATQRWVLVALLVLLPAIAWHGAGGNVAMRARKAGQLMLVVGIIFASCFAVYGAFTYRFEHRVRQLVADHRTVPSWNVLVFMSLRDHGVPTTQAAVQEIREASPSLAAPLVQNRAAARVTAARRRWEGLVRGTGGDAQAPRRAAERLAAEHVVWEEWVSVWQPRYLGMIWPAVAIAACALLMRLPTRPLRCGAIGLLLAVNLTQATARVVAQTEPPADRIAADVLASQEARRGQPTRTETRTWLNGLMGFAVGDRMSNQDAQIRYYLAQVSGRSLTPEDVRNTPYPVSGSPWKPWDLTIRYDRSAREIARDLQGSPSIRRAIVWDGGLYDGGLEKQLAPEWRLAGEETFKYRLHWTWSEFRHYRRREFVRIAEAPQK
jgi:hypothetical protein